MAETVSEILRPAPYAASVTLPASPSYPDNTTFPLCLSPHPSSSSLDEIIAEIRTLSASGKIAALLNRHGGAIYFSGLNLRDADEFSRFAHAFVGNGWKAHEEIGNPVRRTVVAPNVATANEGPNTMAVYPHNEFGLSPHFPGVVMFYCVAAAESGGETPINNSIILYEHLREQHPEFIEEVEKRGIKYQLFHPNGPRDQTASAGTTVLQAYGQHVLDSDDVETARDKIEKEIRRLPTATWRWENVSEGNLLGDLRVFQVLPAVRKHPRTGQTAFFNNAVSRFLNALDNDTLLPPHIDKAGRYNPPVFYGDGGLIPREYLDTAVEYIYQTRSMVKWTAGDVIVIDNHSVQHARQPWTGQVIAFSSLLFPCTGVWSNCE
ncbi:Clavaminate synthase-like protein [Echria macrotheca]|uniref:Clavaminate synthase-like protein n=1 Tax=Echria macrotheca TaxID=438768 RepID=A0AAJ0BEP9_9PEZI|nr:Clavaminate synthase-like protein [Echria macrotheca]